MIKAVSVTERLVGELNSLKLKVWGIPHTLTAEGNCACKSVQLQMKGEFSTVGKVSVEKIDWSIKATSDIREIECEVKKADSTDWRDGCLTVASS